MKGRVEPVDELGELGAELGIPDPEHELEDHLERQRPRPRVSVDYSITPSGDLGFR